jgi:hypothetical protein
MRFFLILGGSRCTRKQPLLEPDRPDYRNVAQASSDQKSCFRPATRLTADSTCVSIGGHVEPLVWCSQMPRVWQLRCTPSSRGRPIQAIRPAIGLSARLFLHGLQWPILRLFPQKKERRRDRREQLKMQTFCCLLQLGG